MAGDMAMVGEVGFARLDGAFREGDRLLERMESRDCGLPGWATAAFSTSEDRTQTDHRGMHSGCVRLSLMWWRIGS